MKVTRTSNQNAAFRFTDEEMEIAKGTDLSARTPMLVFASPLYFWMISARACGESNEERSYDRYQHLGLARKIQADQSGTLQRLARIGFDLVEPLLAPLKEQGECPKVVLSRETLPQFTQECGDLGLAIQTAHVFSDPSIPVESIIDHLAWTHQRSGISNFVFSSQMETFAQAEGQAAFMSSLSEALKKEGCQILYHNHARELRPIPESDGRTAMDHFFEICDPRILLQLDVGWAGAAGNEAEISSKFASRIFSLHFKDFVSGIRGVWLAAMMAQARDTLPDVGLYLFHIPDKQQKKDDLTIHCIIGEKAVYEHKIDGVTCMEWINNAVHGKICSYGIN